MTEAPAVTAAPAAAGPVDLVTLCPRASANAKKLVAELNDAPAAKLKPTLHKLGEMGPAAVGTTSAIRTLLTHKDPYVCIHAALAMFRIDNNATTTLPIMLAGLKHRDAGVRSFAATALGMGPQSQQAIAPLQDALLDSNCYVRLHVAEALAAYPGHESEATSVIVRQLTEKDANVRWLATFLLAELQPQTADAVEGLRVALTDTDPRVRSGAACALGSMGSAAKPALPQLRKAMQDQSADVSQAAADAISDIEATPTQGPLGWNSPASRALRMAKFVRQTHSTSVAQAR